jgi:hypothetical protein
MPIARTSPNSESVFSEKPNAGARERADERHGNRDERNHRRAPRLEEEDHDHHHEGRGLEDRRLHFPHRLRDELRRVVDDVVVEPGREVGAKTGHQRFHAVCRLERVRAWPLEDGNGHRWLVVEIRVGRIVDGAELDAPDVTHANQPAFVGALDQHVAELRRVGEAPEELNADFVGASRAEEDDPARRRPPGRSAPERLDDLATGHAER